MTSPSYLSVATYFDQFATAFSRSVFDRLGLTLTLTLTPTLSPTLTLTP